MISNVDQTLDSIMSIVKRKALTPLIVASKVMIKDIKRWYDESLRAMHILSPYYDGIVIENKVRTLKIWRHPVPRWATSDILQPKYPTSESWHSWERSISLEDLFRSGNATAIIGSILENYSRALQNELLEFEMECKTAKDYVMQAIADMIDHFSRVHSDSLMDESFARSVCTDTRTYRKTSDISSTLVGNKIVDHSDVVGASPVGAAPNTSSFST